MLNEIAPRTRPYRDNADQVPGGSDLQSPAFRADYTFFITCGTSIANQVAYDALAGANKRILVDRTAHQSIHIAAGQSSASVDYAPISTFHPARRPPTALDAARRIAASGTPITVLVTQSAHKSVHTPSARTRSQATSRHGLPGGSTASGCREQVHVHPRPRARRLVRRQ